jgi:large subunit ribosomal protein L13
MRKNKTIFVGGATVKRDWYLVDASGKVLGRLASKVATILMGKHKPIYSPQADTGDYVVIVNADKVRVTGKKEKQKMYFTHSGYPGGDTMTAYEKLAAKKPGRVIELAVAGMLPKNRLGRQLIKKMKIFTGDKHPYLASQVKKLEV